MEPEIKNEEVVDTISESEALQAEEIAISREEVVAELGEEVVAKIEDEAISVEVVADVPAPVIPEEHAIPPTEEDLEKKKEAIPEAL